MSSRVALILTRPEIREKAARWCQKAPPGTRLEFKPPKRTVDQNAKLWACLGDISRQIKYHGLTLSADDWKILFLSALKSEMRLVPNLDGNGFVSLGRSSSDLSKAEFSDLIEIIMAWGAQNGVVFSYDSTDLRPTDASPSASETGAAGPLRPGSPPRNQREGRAA